jgi:GT2 family glycosyltransferase
LFFLNPDTEVIGRAIETLFEGISRLPNLGAIGCKLLNTDGSIQTSCLRPIPTLTNQALDSEFLRRLFPRSALWGNAALLANDPSAEVEALSGACTMMKRSIFEEIGGFSEEFFMYSEDTDLCDKVRRAGYKNYYISNASIVHHGGSSSKQCSNHFADVVMRESIWRFLRKTRGSAYALGYRVSIALAAACRLALVTLALPLQVLGRKRELKYTFGKWVHLLGWALGCSKLAKSNEKRTASS